jgi:hypothetical protein
MPEFSPGLSQPGHWRGKISCGISIPTKISRQFAALQRVKKAASEQTQLYKLNWNARLSIAENPVEIRSFENTPRDEGEIQLGSSWMGEMFSGSAQVTWVDDPADDKEWRADGSHLGMQLGNWMLAGTVQDRWWGPGWQGSMILSNNARPLPGFSFERMSTRPFETKWLSWLGAWDFSMNAGFFESDRVISNAWFFGMRLTLRPFRSLEIGLSRTAQWCGDDEPDGRERPCDADTFVDLLLGNDNEGDNVSREDEPGNQLAGWDIRWSNDYFSEPFALYTQWIGEDEGGNAPAKYSALFGAETWGTWRNVGTYRVFFEWADTMCNFRLYKGDDFVPNCAYNNKIYQTGYRYRGRSVAHTYDNDASVFTLGSILTDNKNNSWMIRLNYGNLNRQGEPDERNTVAQVKTRYGEIQLNHQRDIGFGKLKIGAGYDYRDNTVTNENTDDIRVFLQWGMSSN